MVQKLTFRYHHENNWVDYLHQDKQKTYYKFLKLFVNMGKWGIIELSMC